MRAFDSNSPATVMQGRSYWLLRQLDVFCRKHDIPYILCGGSLLGAARHRGIIPWDDDVDVGMRRCDYDRLVELMQRETPPGTFWYSCETDQNCPWQHGKLLKHGEDVVSRDCPMMPVPRELGIDVFPLDGLPSGRLRRRLFWWRAKFLLRLQLLLSDGTSRSHAALKAFVRRIVSPFVTRSAVRAAYLRLARGYPSTPGHDLICTCTNYSYHQEVYLADWLDRTVPMRFGEEYYRVPMDWHTYLVRHYGAGYRRPHRGIREGLGHYRLLNHRQYPVAFSLIVVADGNLEPVEHLLSSLAELPPEPSFEVILVERNRESVLESLVTKYSAGLRVTHLCFGSAGVSAARNIGLMEAHGEYVTFPDVDCRYAPETLRNVLHVFSERAQFDAVVAGTGAGGPQRQLGPDDRLDRIVASQLFFRRETVRAIGSWDERFGHGFQTEWNLAEDYDYLMRALKIGCNVLYDPAVCVSGVGPVKVESRWGTYALANARAAVRRKHHPSSWNRFVGNLRLTGHRRCPFDFSVVLAAYNVAPYLEEAVDSLRRQTIGFDRIQVILVDDGSTDGTGDICTRLAARHPRNVLALHQPNGGVSAARNLGMRHAVGRYVNFMDSDDLFDADTFAAVRDFFDAHQDETDVVAVRTYYFEGRVGEKNTNFRFGRRDPATGSRNRIVDLDLEPEAFQHVTNSSFVRWSLALRLQFDTRLRYHEDVAYMVRALACHRRVGLVAVGAYRQRKRLVGGSATQVIDSDAASYLPTAELCLNGSMNWLRAQEGEVPQYAQSMLLFANEYKILLPDYPAAMSQDDRRRYEELLCQGLGSISDDMIYAARIPLARRYACLYFKHGRIPGFTEVVGKDFERATCSVDFLEIGPSSIVVDFRLFPFGTLPSDCRCGLMVRREGLSVGEFIEGALSIREQTRMALGHELKLVVTRIRAVVGLNAMTSCEIRPVIRSADGIFRPLKVSFNKTAPLTEKLPEQGCVRGNWYLVTMTDPTGCTGFRVARRRILATCCQEARLFRKLWRNRWNPVARKALAMRMACHLLRPLKRRPIWIVSDRALVAGDNGQAMFEYLMSLSAIPTNPRVYFCLSRKSSSYASLRRVGPVVEPMGFRHMLLFMLGDLVISSQASPMELAPYSGNGIYNRDIARNHSFVFLQHGIIKDDLSGWANRWNHDARLFVTSATKERNSILNGNYGYSEREIRLTGLPRFDKLENRARKVVTVMPTWRAALVGKPDKLTGVRPVNAGFEQTVFFRQYMELLADSAFIDACAAAGYVVQFVLHPEMRSAQEFFKFDSRVRMVPLDEAYSKIFAETNLLVTDYSSTAFDFAYLRKPVLYVQADRDEFFRWHSYRPGYFSYERDGFGEVVMSVDALRELILDYLARDCRLRPEYRSRIDEFFPYDDRGNCERVLRAIVGILDDGESSAGARRTAP